MSTNELDVQIYKQLRSEGATYQEIADGMNVSLSRVYRALNGVKHKAAPTVEMPTIFVIGDTQCRAGEDLSYMKWIANYIKTEQPKIIVHIGDHYDMSSLSSYDKGKLLAEGKRFHEDLEAGDYGLDCIEAAIASVPNYNPRKIVTLGNHEERIMRWVQENPEFSGYVGYDLLGFKDHGWEVYDYLKPVDVHGIKFVHYLANPMSGKPLGGTVKSRLAKVRSSFVMGHQQTLECCLEPMPLEDGKFQIGIIVGACYPHDEGYKGYQGNKHFRGGVLLYEVQAGAALFMPVSLDYMKRKYEESL